MSNKCLFCNTDHDSFEPCAGDDLTTNDFYGAEYEPSTMEKLEDIADSATCEGKCVRVPTGKLCASCLAAEALSHAEKFMRNALAECERRMEEKE